MDPLKRALADTVLTALMSSTVAPTHEFLAGKEIQIQPVSRLRTQVKIAERGEDGKYTRPPRYFYITVSESM